MIQWTYSNVNNVRLEVSYNSGGSWSSIVTNVSVSQLQYSWLVPNVNYSTCLIRITDLFSAVSDESDQVFSISTPPNFLALLDLTEAKSFVPGAGTYIQWAQNNVNTVKLEYSESGIGIWNTITASVAGSAGYFNWMIPSNVRGDVKIRISSVNDPLIIDTSAWIPTHYEPQSTDPYKYQGGSYDGYSMASSLADSINVVFPNGGESLIPNQSTTITWTSNNVDNVKIEYSLNGGSSWQILSSNVSSSQRTFLWNVPNNPTNQALIRITDLKSGLNDISDFPFTIITPQVQLIYPNGAEVLGAGRGSYIRWTSQYVSTVNIEYSLNNGASWTTIASNINTSQDYLNWTVPNQASSQVKVRIIDAGSPSRIDETDAILQIQNNILSADLVKYKGGDYDGYAMQSTQPIQLNVVFPNNGDTLYPGSSVSISWSYSNCSNIKVEFSSDSGLTWNILKANITASSLGFSWSVPSLPSNQCLIKTTDLFTGISDISDAVFSIFSPAISIVYPEGGESFHPFEGRMIRWTSLFVSNVKLEYSINGGVNWILLVNSISANEKYFNITIPNTSSTNAKFKLTDLSNSSVFSISNAFNINSNSFPLVDPMKYYGGDYDGYDMKSNVDSLPNWIITSPNLNPVLYLNSTHNIEYFPSENFNQGNIFYVQLSDSTGDFAESIDLASLAATIGGSISVTIPDSVIPGDKYRIRVIANDPPTLGFDNGNDLQIIPEFAISSFFPDSVYVGDTLTIYGEGFLHSVSGYVSGKSGNIILMADTMIKIVIPDSIYDDRIVLNSSFLQTAISTDSIRIKDDLIGLSLSLYIQGYYRGNDSMVSALPGSLECDSINVILIQENSIETIAYSQKAIFDLTGKLYVRFKSVMRNSNFYIVLKHRNSIETWSSSVFSANANIQSYDFSKSSSSAYGSNLVNLLDGNFALWSGDVNQDGIIDSVDFNLIENSVSQFRIGYLSEDLTGDLIIEEADYSLIENNINLFLITSKP